DNLPSILSLLWLNLTPKPANISHRCIRKVGLCCSVLNSAFRPYFRPAKIRVDRLVVETLKSGDPHSRINQDILNLHRTNHNLLFLCMPNASKSAAAYDKACCKRKHRSDLHSLPTVISVQKKSSIIDARAVAGRTERVRSRLAKTTCSTPRQSLT